MRLVLPTLVLAVLLTSCQWRGTAGPAVNPDPNHTHADFTVWVADRKLDFSDEKYMSGSLKEETGDTHGRPHRHPFFHLHDGVSHVIHRHKPGLMLGEFLSSIGVDVQGDCVLFEDSARFCTNEQDVWRMLVNGRTVPFNAGYVFQDIDRILLTYGTRDAAIDPRQVELLTNDACLYSRTCPERGKPPQENCIADPEVPCVESQ